MLHTREEVCEGLIHPHNLCVLSRELLHDLEVDEQLEVCTLYDQEHKKRKQVVASNKQLPTRNVHIAPEAVYFLLETSAQVMDQL